MILCLAMLTNEKLSLYREFVPLRERLTASTHNQTTKREGQMAALIKQRYESQTEFFHVELDLDFNQTFFSYGTIGTSQGRHDDGGMLIKKPERYGKVPNSL